jgi:CTP:molybdopterin cytidylyltransferase MocA
VIVVLGCENGEIRDAVPDGTRVILSTRWREGQQSSLRCPLAHIPQNSALMIYPVDHPLLRKATMIGLVRAFHGRRKAEKIAPRHKDRLGHPIIVSAALRSAFFSAETAREIVY